MNFLTRLLVPKVAGAIGGVMLAIIAALSIFSWTQSVTIRSQKTELAAVKSLTIRLDDYADKINTAVQQKDKAIREQSASIEAMEAAAKANRAEYDKSIAAAKAAAQSDKDRASQLMKLNPVASDELTQCRMARDLLELELTQ